uniref:type II toxin-antitoxin system CcdA family antitoxin n=1 Tax=Ningiella ruwaisensis TaxID=2364274 RepID=UPI00109F28E3|nr:type II toxin-antitoxin system CcdA family antitoxin [Ningiella ruwaisensis]
MRQKVSCNTTISKSLLSEAKTLNLKLSEIFESALAQEVARKKSDIWLKENHDAIAKHNQNIVEKGTFSENTGQLND